VIKDMKSTNPIYAMGEQPEKTLQRFALKVKRGGGIKESIGIFFCIE
jgi:hypothetical protein